MATQKLTTLFEEVRTGINVISTINKKIAQENANWFYEKCKKNFPSMTDLEIETEAKHLIKTLLGAKTLLIQKINIKRNNVIVQNSKLKTGEKKMPVPSVEGSIGTYLIKKLIKYFNLIENPDYETEMSGYKRCLETLQKSFPHWKADGCKAVVSIFYLRYYSYLKTDKNAIIDRITKAFEISTKSKPVSSINPGYLITLAYQNKSLHDLDNYSSDKIQATSLDYYPAFDELINKFSEEIGDFDKKSSSDKLKDLWNWIKGFSSLTDKEKDLINTFIQEAIKEHSSYRHYTDACKKIFMEGGGTYANFRTILKRIREEIRKDDNKAASGFMQFSTNFNWKFENIIKSLNLIDAKKTTNQDNMTNMDESEISDEEFTEGEEKGMLDELIINNSEINLKAYRLWPKEIIIMEWLREVFKKNGLYVGRYPEIYYDDFDTACKIFPSLEEKRYIEERNPDYLGVYIDFSMDNQNNKDPFLFETKEGVIILFKDRIEKCFDENKIRTTDEEIKLLCYVVLMHELGHWFMHMARHTATNGILQFWNLGYDVYRIKTEEGLANLIAYWCVEGDPEALKVLEKLTPSNINNSYACYQLLVKKSKTEILEKLKELRTAFYLKDEVMFDYLLSENKTLFDDYIDCSKPTEYFDNTKKITQAVYENILANGGILKPGWFGITEDQYQACSILNRQKLFNK